jgi:hypothetical protein
MSVSDDAVSAANLKKRFDELTTRIPGYKPNYPDLNKPSCTRRDHLLELVVDLLRGHTVEVVADSHESNPNQNFQQLVLLIPCIKEGLNQFARNTSALRH